MLPVAVNAAPVEQRAVGDDYRRSTADASPYYSQTQPAQAPPVDANNADPLWEILNQVQMLQTEVLELRGTIDQQAYEIQQLQAQQKQHYVDLDQRIEALGGSSGNAADSLNKTDNSDAPASKLSSNPFGAARTNEATMGSSQIKESYQEALNFIRDRDYKKAQENLREILQGGGDSFYVPFAHYWLAEVLVAQPNPDMAAAQQHFSTVVDQFAGHSKVPPSLYKLGTIQHVSGDTQKARETLQRLIKEFPGTSEAGMASHYLEQISG